MEYIELLRPSRHTAMRFIYWRTQAAPWMGVQEAVWFYTKKGPCWLGGDKQCESIYQISEDIFDLETHCRQPFYAAIPTEKIVEDADPTSKKRSPFNNHAFLCYTNSQGRQVALDACIGPHVGTESIEEYLKAHIDNSHGKSEIFYPKGGLKHMYSIDPNYHLLPGITAINNSHHPYKSREFLNGIPDAAFKADKVEWEAFAKLAKVHPGAPFNVNLAEFFEKIQIAVKTLVSHLLEGDQELRFRLHRPRVLSSKEEGVFFLQAGLDVVARDRPRPLVSISIRMLPTVERAIAEVNWFLMSLSRHFSDLLFKGDFEEPKVLGHLYLEAKPPSCLTIFVYGNMMVHLDGTVDGAAMKSIAKEAEKLLNTTTGDYPTIADHRINIKAQQNIALDEEFDVIVAVSWVTPLFF